MLRSRARSSAVAAIAGLLLAFAAAEARAEGNRPAALQLEVWINGEASGLVAAFHRRADGGFQARPAELRELGLELPARCGEAEIALSALSGVSARYDVPHQRLYLKAAPSALRPTVLEARAATAPLPRAEPAALGMLVNYSLAAGVSQRTERPGWDASGLGAEVEARVFGRFGLLSSGFTTELGAPHGRDVRLDTTWSWSDPESLLTWRAGDVIGGGFGWTRPVRLGGLQLRRDFGLRPDLITMPAPSLEGSAAVPSTAEVLLNGDALASQSVRSGPVQVLNLQPMDGANHAQLVLHDTLGRETVYSIDFFVTPDLLTPGAVDFSLEAGLARRDFGLRSLDYQSSPSASASLRAGVTDRFTAELHAEAGARLAALGVGGVFSLGGVGVASASAAVSDHDGEIGGQIAADARAQLGTLALTGRIQQTVGRYTDLGALTAQSQGAARLQPGLFAPPRRLLQFGVSTPLRVGAWGGSGPNLAFNATSAQPVVGPSRTVVDVEVRQTLRHGASLFASGYAATGPRGGDRGAYLGLSIPLGRGRSVTAGARNGGSGGAVFAEAAQDGDLQPGSFSWRLRAQGGAMDDLEAEAAYRAGFGAMDVRAQRLAGAASLQARMDGAIVVMGGQAFAANRIDDAFAVVDAGAAHVPVTLENRPVGVTGLRGRILVPYLSAYDRNTIAIDADALPADVATLTTHRSVFPSRGAGVVVRFPLRPVLRGAVVVLRSAGGEVLPAGSQGHVRGDGEGFVIGYDGLAYLEGVRPGAQLDVRTPDGRACSARLGATTLGRQTLDCS